MSPLQVLFSRDQRALTWLLGVAEDKAREAGRGEIMMGLWKAKKQEDKSENYRELLKKFQLKSDKIRSTS